MRVYFATTMYPNDADGFRGVFMRNVLAALERVPALDLTAWTPPGDLPRGVRPATTAPQLEWLAKLLNDAESSHFIRAGRVRGRVAPISLLHHLRAGYRTHTDLAPNHLHWQHTPAPLYAD